MSHAWPAYRSHKVVRALKILTVSAERSPDGSRTLALEDGSGFKRRLDDPFWARYVPTEGDYLVEYDDNYLSVSPEKAFKEGYHRLDQEVPASAAGYDFGWALAQLKAGKRATRLGWNGKGMWLYLVAGSTFGVNRAPLLGIYEQGHKIDYRAHIDMKTADGSCVPWVASQTDLLAADWAVAD